MTRFFVTAQELCADVPVLTGENAAHARVLRLREGETVALCDGAGWERICTVRQVGDGTLTLAAGPRQPSASESAVRVSVYMAYPKGDKLEHVIQKATELGAYEIVAFPSGRCVSRPDEKSLRKKAERWQKIAAAAAEQSGRGRIPEVVVLSRYEDALRRGAQAALPLLFYEKEDAVTLHMALEQGALSGKYDTAHPLPAGSQRGDTYNPLLPQIEKLVAAMRTVGDKYGITPAQVALAWAIGKGTTPIIGVTKPAQVQDALEAIKVTLTDDEMKVLEETAENTGVDTRGAWEMPMI